MRPKIVSSLLNFLSPTPRFTIACLITQQQERLVLDLAEVEVAVEVTVAYLLE